MPLAENTENTNIPAHFPHFFLIFFKLWKKLNPAPVKHLKPIFYNFFPFFSRWKKRQSHVCQAFEPNFFAFFPNRKKKIFSFFYPPLYIYYRIYIPPLYINIYTSSIDLNHCLFFRFFLKKEKNIIFCTSFP